MNIRKPYIWGLLLVLCALLPLQASAKTAFTDVSDRYWAKDAIQWAYDEGLTSGYPNGTFKPEQAITEAQLVTMLIRFDSTSPRSFPAKKGEHKSMGNYRYLAGHFLPLHGINSRFARDSSVERAYAAKILAAFQGKDLYVQQAVYYLYTNDLAIGITGKNDYDDFLPKNDLTRAETVNFLYQMAKKQGRSIQGLSAKATGKDNAQYAKPPKFTEDDELEFERPNQPSLPGTNPETPAGNVAVDVEKPVLTANGKDETFITFTFRDCNGELIPYDRELEFTVASREGARIEVADRTGELQESDKPTDVIPSPENPPVPEPPVKPDEEDPDREFAEAGKAEALSSASTMASPANFGHPHVISDGPEVTVKVIAPRSTSEKIDTITVAPVSKAGACPLPVATANITYVPRAEIQLLIRDYMGQSTITATMARPGGSTITNFNGYLNLESLYSLPFSQSSPRFINGVASVTYGTPTILMKNEITATATSTSPVTDEAVRSILDKSFSVPVSYAPPITADNTCTNEKPEIGFLIDSSGSMKRNDRGRLRVTKTQEFIRTLQADVNIATHFTTSGMFLKKDAPYPTAESIKDVKQSGGTNIANGLKVAFSKFTTEQPKTLILLTDGKSSKAPILAQLEDAKKHDIKIYTIGLGKNLDSELLKQIASETGGQYFHIKENIELPLVYQSILQEISCGIPIQTCSLSASIFESPSVNLTSQDILMSTELSTACGPIEKVIVRFSSKDGHLDYELTHRGQGIYRLNKKAYELQDFLLRGDATFIAYNQAGKSIGEQKVKIQKQFK